MKVSVLLPAYNAESFIGEAIESLLNQTFTDFELLIINDGSIDSTEDIILSYNDLRIRYIKNEENLKLIATLNKGLKLAKGKYIARMDADDISLPTRLEKQFYFMEGNLEYGLCGSFVEAFGDKIESRIVKYETEHDKIKFRLFFDTHFPHPTAFIRAEVLRANNLYFDKNYIHAEDFMLWNQFARVSKIKILSEPLVKKRGHEHQVSVKYNNVQKDISTNIRKELITALGFSLSEETKYIWSDFLMGNIPNKADKIYKLLVLFERMVYCNQQKNWYNQQLFTNFFAYWYWQVCAHTTHLGFPIWNKYYTSIFNKRYKLTWKNHCIFFLKCLFKKPKEMNYESIIHT